MARRYLLSPQVWIFIPAVLLLMIAVACGGDDATPTTAPTVTSVPPTATTGPLGADPTATTAAPEAPDPTATTVGGAGTGRVFINTPTPLPGAEPTATSVAPPEDDFKVGDRRIVGGVVEIKYGEPKYGGRLQVQAVHPIVNWDPHGEPSMHSTTSSNWTNALLQWNPWTFERYDIWGDLAESWSQVDVEGRVWEFKIKPHAIWSDGMPVTAEDVVFSFDRMTGKLPNHPVEAGLHQEPNLYLRPHYDHAEAIDEKTVQIFLNGTWADFLGYAADDLLMILPKHVYEDLDARFQTDPDIFKDIENSFKNVVASGPFKPSFVNTKDEYGYDRNPTYWKLDPEGRSLPYLDGLDYFRIPDRTASQAAWEAEQVWSSNHQHSGNMSPGQMTEMIEAGGGKFVSYPAACCPSGLAMNITRPPFDDHRVRKALMLALDRQTQMDLVWSGFGVLGTFCGPPGHPLCLTADEVLQLPGWRYPKDQDIAEARRLMADAGYEDGFETTFITREFINFKDEGPVLQDTLRRSLGLDIEHIVLDTASANDAQAGGNYDLFHSGSGAGVITPDQYLNRFFLLPGPSNPYEWVYCGPCIGEEDVDLHALIREQSTTVDLVERRRILRIIDDIVLTKDTHIVMNYTWTFARLTNVDKVGGQQPTQSGYIETKAEQLWLLNP